MRKNESLGSGAGRGAGSSKKWIWILILLALLPFAGILAANSLNPVGTARSFLRASDLWQNKWPFTRGKYVPVYLNNLLYNLRILRPVKTEVHGFILELDPRDLVTQSILLSGIWEPESTRIVESLQEG